MTCVIAVSAGTHEVGTTTIAAGLAIALAKRGRRTCLLDADWGPSSTGAVLKYHPDKTLVDLLDGKAQLDEVVQRDVCGVDIILGDTAAERMSALTSGHLQELAGQLSGLRDYDYLVIDVASGADRTVTSFLEASDVLLLVITPDGITRESACSVLKRLREHHSTTYVMTVVNQCRNTVIGRHAYAQFREITEFYLHETLPLLGLVCNSRQTARPEKQVLEQVYGAGNDFEMLADKILLQEGKLSGQTMHEFWQNYLKAAGIEAEYIDYPQTDTTIDSLESHLDTLSARVEALIERVNRCKEFVNQEKEVAESRPPVESKIMHAYGPGYWLGALDYQPVTEQGETLDQIYRIRRSSGATLLCAYYEAEKGGFD